MKWKNRLTNYNFWISIISAVLLILQAFNIELDIAYFNEISTAVLGLLVVIGIISDPTKTFAKDPTETKSVSENKLEEEKTESVEIIPINETVENTDDLAKNDFKVLVDKISADLEDNLKDISSIQQSILEKLNKQVLAEQANTTKEVEETTQPIETNENNCLNIVNN